ncbi:MAG: phosphatidylglycerol lysyltransferase domain-containing protein [Bryobacteraceae bacterium]
MPRFVRPRHWLVPTVALVTLGSGVINLYSVIGPSLRERHALLREVFPLEFLHLARFLTLLIGFFLVVSSINIYKRKRRAFVAVLALAAGSIVFHLTKGLDYEEATFSFVLLLFLWTARREFVVKSSTPSWDWALVRLGVAFLIALGYGVAGFWFLDPRQFGINFTIGASIHQTMHFLLLSGDPEIVPHTRYARWFLDSLYVTTVTAMTYSVMVLFRPAIYRFRTHPHECQVAATIVQRYGRSAMDFFKTWPDKSFFFSPDQQCFVAYRVGANFAVVLGDPVGEDGQIESTVRSFRYFCIEHDWGLGFHQVLPDFLPIYLKLGFKKMKIGDDAIVDLASFTLQGKKAQDARGKLKLFDKMGVQVQYYPAPIPDPVMLQLKEVSDEWLQLPGRRERQFSLGKFGVDYVGSTPVLTAEDPHGRVLGFLNIVPSYCKGEAVIDLMRRRSDAPNGIMDLLFVKAILRSKEQGYERFSLGMAPMSGFQEKEEASAQERAVHAFFQQLNFLFSYKGLRFFKAKFATHWEPRYVIYRNVLDLPRLTLALGKVSEIPE